MTLTLDPRTAGLPGQSHEYIRGVWKKFRVYLARKLQENGQKLKWVSVVEFQKNGYAHLHVILNRNINQSWISENWEALGGGKIADIRAVKQAARIGAYLAKYLSKGFTESAFKPGQRRFSASYAAGIMKGAAGQFSSMMTLYRSLDDLVDQNKELLVSLSCGLDGILSTAEFSQWPPGLAIPF